MLEAGLVAYLRAALPTTQFYCGRQPEKNTVFPNVVYQVSTQKPFYVLAGYCGLTDSTVQFSCWGLTYLDAANTAESLRGVLEGYKGSMGSVTIDNCVRLNQFAADPAWSDDASDTAHFRTVAEYRLFFHETIPAF